MPSGIDTMTIIVNTEDFIDREQDILAGIHHAVSPDSIVLESDLSLIAVVGRGMKASRGVAAIIFNALARENINIKMIDQGSSELNIIVGNPPFFVVFNKSHLKAILLNSAGSDEYVRKGLLHPQTILVNASGTYGKAIAEHTIGMILALNKNIKTYVKQMNEHLWEVVPTGKEIYQSCVVIVGLGDLGYELAKRLKTFECHIIGIKRTKSDLLPCVDEIYTTEYLDKVLPQADFVISTLP